MKLEIGSLPDVHYLDDASLESLKLLPQSKFGREFGRDWEPSTIRHPHLKATIGILKHDVTPLWPPAFEYLRTWISIERCGLWVVQMASWEKGCQNLAWSQIVHLLMHKTDVYFEFVTFASKISINPSPRSCIHCLAILFPTLVPRAATQLASVGQSAHLTMSMSSSA